MSKPKLNIWHDPWHFLAAGYGLGNLPLMPGTFGSLTGLFFVWLISGFNLTFYLLFTLFVCLFGIWLCDKVSKDLGVHDHGGIVWDEIAGILITFINTEMTAVNFLAGFLLFRLFDIFKPWPISYVDKHIKGGLGIMLDDILAAVPAWILLQLFMHFF